MQETHQKEQTTEGGTESDMYFASNEKEHIKHTKGKGTGKRKSKHIGTYTVEHAGVGVLLMGEARLKLTDIKPISSRLIRLEMNTIPRTTIICAYAPTSAHTDEAKDQFYDALQNEIDHTRRNRPLIVAGDFNARLHARNVDEHALL